jgi:putative spermidine/putrescine transport system permease protein
MTATEARSPIGWLVLPAALTVLAFLAAPMALLFRFSLNRHSPTEFMVEALTLANYARFFADTYYAEVMLTTIRVAATCTLVTLILAFPPAYILARMQGRWKSPLTIITIFPLLVGNVVRAAGWMGVMGDRGAINATLMGLGITTAPTRLLYTEFAVTTGIIAVVLPYMILTLASVIEGIAPALEEAAGNLGAPPFTVFRRVVLPLALPGVAAGTALVFILCMNAYATPVLLGGPQFKMMAPAVADQFNRTINWPFGGALAFILMTATMLLTVTATVLLRGKAGGRQ